MKKPGPRKSGKKITTEDWEYGYLCYVAIKQLRKQLPSVIWKIENVSNELVDLTKEISPPPSSKLDLAFSHWQS